MATTKDIKIVSSALYTTEYNFSDIELKKLEDLGELIFDDHHFEFNFSKKDLELLAEIEDYIQHESQEFVTNNARECCRCSNPDCPYCNPKAEFQCDSEHSGVLSTALGMGAAGADALGLTNVASKARKVAQISSSIGELLGCTGMFDQPSVPIQPPFAGAVVDVPQVVNSTYFHKGDFIKSQKEMFSSSNATNGIKNRIKIPALIKTIEWSNQTAGAQLAVINVCPQTVRETPERLEESTPLSYYATFFNSWRGSIDITVEVVSTALHQGQLFLAFAPENLNSVSDPTMDQLRTVPYIIMDVSTTRRVSERVTYLSETDYKSTTRVSADTWSEDAVGRFYVMVLNPLIAPTTVDSKVEINVYFNAGEDFEYVEPDNGLSTLYYDLGTLQSSWGDEDYESDTGGVEEVQSAPSADLRPVRESTSEESTMISKSRVRVVDQWRVRPNTKAEEVCANVATAHTANVVGREYLVKINVPWATSKTQGELLHDLPLPSALWTEDLALTGLFRYHAFQHSDFEVRYKVNPSKFHAGKLIAYFVPDLPGYDESFAAATQYNHAFIDMQGETEAVVRVPYSSWKRMMHTNTNPSFGSVHLSVWNPLRTGATQPGSLTISIFVRPVNPYVGVKGVKLQTATFQSDEKGKDQASDSARGIKTLVPAFRDQLRKKGLGLSAPGYINTSHTDEKDLLRRPDFVGRFRVDIPADQNGRWLRIARVPTFAGRLHRAIAAAYTYWSGSNKLTFINSYPVTTDMQMAYAYAPAPAEMPAGLVEEVVPYPIIDSLPSMRGMVFTNAIDRAITTVEVPMYKRTPMVRATRNIGENTWNKSPTAVITSKSYADSLPIVDVFIMVPITGLKMTVTVFHSVGDDFELYLPRALPKCIQAKVPESGAMVPKFSGQGPYEGWNATSVGPSGKDITDPWRVFDRAFNTINIPEGTYELGTTTALKITIPTKNPAYIALASPSYAYSRTFFIQMGPISSELYWPANTVYVVIPYGGGNVTSCTFSFFGKFEGLSEVQFYSLITPSTAKKATFLTPRVRPRMLVYSDDEDLQRVELQDDPAIGELQDFSIGACMSRVQNLFRDTRAALEGLRTLIGLNDVAGKLLSAENVRNALQFLAKLLDDTLTFVSGVLMVARGDTLMQTFGLMQLGKLLMGHVVPELSKPRAGELQAGEACVFFPWVTSFVSYIKAFLSLHSSYRVKCLKKYVTIITAKKEGMELVFGAIEAILTYIVTGDKALYMHACTKAEAFVERVIGGVTKENSISLLEDRSEIDRIACMFTKERLPATYEKYSRKLDEELRKLELDNGTAGAIPEPIGLYFHAAPGVGKSTVLCRLLPALVMSELKIKKPREQFIANMVADANGRIDKYDGQEFAILDEFASSRDSEEPATVIKFISQFAEPVQSAFMEKKKQCFRSRVLMLLSNLNNVACHSNKVNNIDAFARRFSGRSFTVKVKAGKTFDYSVFNACVESALAGPAAGRFNRICAVVDDQYDFVPIDIMTGQSILTPVYTCFRGIVNDLLKEWKHRETSFAMGEAIMDKVAYADGELQVDDGPGMAVGGHDDDDDQFEDANSNHRIEPTRDNWDVRRDIITDIWRTEPSFMGMHLSETIDKLRPEEYPFLAGGDEEKALTGDVDEIHVYAANFRIAKRLGAGTRVNGGTMWNLGNKADWALKRHWARQVIAQLTDRGIVQADYSGLPDNLPQLKKFLIDIVSPQTNAPGVTLNYPGLAGWWGVVLGATVASVSIGLIVAGLRKIIDAMRTVCAESGYSGDSWKVKPRQVTKAGIAKVMLQDDVVPDERHEKIRRNLRRLRISTLDGATKTYSCATCITNNIFVTNKHFLERADAVNGIIEMGELGPDGTIIRYTPLPMKSFKIVECGADKGSSDAVIVYTGRFVIPRARDISSFLPSKGEKKGIISSLMLSYDYEKDRWGKLEVGEWSSFECDGGIHGNVVIRASQGFGFHSSKGDCGLPYLDNTNTPLLGVHCAAFTRGEHFTCVAQIWKEMIQVSDSIYPEQVELECELVENFEEPVFVIKNARLNDKLIESNTNPVSSLVRMSKNGVEFNHKDWPDKMKPAILGRVGTVDPWAVGITKYVPRATAPIANFAVNAVTQYWKELMNINTYEMSLDRKYTMHEAFNGVADPNGMRPMQWSTGMGVWAIYPEKGKGGLFKQTVDEDGKIFRELAPSAQSKVHPLFKETFADRLVSFDKKLRQGVVPFSPWVATLKDELRPIEKVNAGKTRIFEQPGVDYTIFLRMYFGAFLDWYKSRAGFEWCHGIGQDKETVWKAYYMGLREVGEGKNCFDLDYSGYDGSVCQQAFIFFEEITDFFYEKSDEREPENKTARHALLEGLRCAPVVMRRMLIETGQGNKSGNAMTDVFNSVTNVFVLHCTYIILMASAGIRISAADFHLNCRALVYGDDVVFSVTKDTREWLNPTQMAGVLEAFGYRTTAGNKSENIEYRDISVLTFLKSRFVYDKGVVWAPMPEQDIVKELQWVKKAQKDDEIDFRERIIRTRQFMAHHGKSKFDSFTEQLRSLGVGRGLLITSWEQEKEAVAARQSEVRITSAPTATEYADFY